MAIDDKLSILDIKARDDRGRIFNVEMQMVAGDSLPQRFLFYWAKLYSQQLAQGDDYARLRPTISICFINGHLFPIRADYHRCFRLRETNESLLLTDNLAIHVIEISNFERELGDLKKPLDFWLYFLKNGVGLDADTLPEPLDTQEIRQAMGVLKMLSQDDLERELYEGRLKAKRDLQTRETLLGQALQQRADAERRLDEVTRERDSATRERDSATRERDQAIHGALVQRIQLCERLLGRTVTDGTGLRKQNEETLSDLADRLERELTSPP